MNVRHVVLQMLLAGFAGGAACQDFPQSAVNSALQRGQAGIAPVPEEYIAGAVTGLQQYLRKATEWTSALRTVPSGTTQAIDTLFVGLTPGDTVVIDSVYQNNGPVFVFGDGVLIFDHADATIYGDVYVLQNGQLLADSSVLTFPQQYFYQRSLIVANNGSCIIRNSTLHYSGLSHNLAAADSAYLELNNVVNSDWTTAGAWGSPTIEVDGTNVGGEYILTGNSSTSFRNVHTLLLWHHFPLGSTAAVTFPPGDSLYAYQFDSTLAGVSGVGYHTEADSCYNVWWGIMPVNGSDITVSNSKLRTIGAWFEAGDTATVSGLIDNSSYAAFTAPLSDRNLQLNSTTVQTWSLYVFDSSHIDLTSCIVGEIGLLGRATAVTQSFLLDGSGGYFWASDTSFLIAVNAAATSNVRSERNGIFLFGYGTVANGQVSATGQSVMIAVQSTLPQEPVPYDEAVAWVAHIVAPSMAFTNDMVAVTGSAWIDQGPLGSWMDFGSYSLFYRKANDTVWTAIVTDSLNEVHNSGIIGTWNTTGLSAGSYDLRLLVKNNLGDSVDAVKSVLLQPGSVSTGMLPGPGQGLQVFPNPANDRFIIVLPEDARTLEGEWLLSDATGRIVLSGKTDAASFSIPIGLLPAGRYMFRVKPGGTTYNAILEVAR